MQFIYEINVKFTNIVPYDASTPVYSFHDCIQLL